MVLIFEKWNQGLDNEAAMDIPMEVDTKHAETDKRTAIVKNVIHSSDSVELTSRNIKYLERKGYKVKQL